LPPGIDQKLTASIGKLWRSWKNKLKRDWFLPYQTDSEMPFCGEDRVLEDQWVWLVSYWNSEAGKVMLSIFTIGELDGRP
jgi:hypothetical protein